MYAKSRQYVHISLQYDIYDSPSPSTFRRLSSTSPEAPLFPSPPHWNSAATTLDRASIVLTSELGEGATGVVHGGKLLVDVDGHGPQALDVAVKLSMTFGEKESLHKEYLRWAKLQQRGVKGIPNVLDYYEDIDSGGPRMLLMLNAGVPLWAATRRITPADR